ncbi:hypothetical protein HHK36_001156 [Tetracentron sinense]|uniref:Kinesin motor domain-containing protein n=1 Tax=Tetracentron sinense TaxID=13715 RepID=A0A834ZT89_TETSI|nr:hypothetical protein HHK36_001156 [Tetracentron sinense]
MDSPTPDSARLRANLGSILGRKVRIVGKIRASTDLEIDSSNGVLAPWISVRKSDGESPESVTISFGDQSTSRKDTYRLDYCYEQDEGADQIFSREVKPMISGIFGGLNASVIAYGARGSGKTHTIQGSDENPGLAPLAMAEILSTSEEVGRLVTMSCYEVYQDHVYDLLEPKEQEVLIMEDAEGRIQLKGLSQASLTGVRVNTIAEFHKFYFHGCTSRKPAQKLTNDVSHRSHKGLIVHVSHNNKDSDTHLVGKMNFVDLAGYEDARRKSNDGPHLVETTRINKSLYALQNVIYALNTNEIRVPYRESKLTRMLQDSLVGTNQTLMITCLNPYFCQDTIHTVSLASRSFQILNRLCIDSTKKIKTGARPMAFCSPKIGIPKTPSTSVKKHNSQWHAIEKKTSGVPSAMKGRKLFDGAHPIISSKQDVFLLNEHSNLELATGNEFSATLTLLEDNNTEKENNSSLVNEGQSPPLSARLQELSNSLKSLCASTPLNIKMQLEGGNSRNSQVCTDLAEPKTPTVEHSLRFNDNWETATIGSPREIFNMCSSGLKNSLVQEYVRFLNSASKEELKKLHGIGEKRANYILELREESPEPFKDLNDLKDIGLSAKQICQLSLHLGPIEDADAAKLSWQNKCTIDVNRLTLRRNQKAYMNFGNSYRTSKLGHL